MANTNSSTTDVDDVSASASHLTCYFRSRNENGDDIGRETTSGKASIVQEAGKKSSYLLQRKQSQPSKNTDGNDYIDWYSIPKPAHLVVERDKYSTTTADSNTDCSFFFGGLQLVFSAKNIEIFLTGPEGKETYLMTCKGIPYKMNAKDNVSNESASIRPKVNEWRRALCVVPGGPRCISRLRIKFIGSTATSDSIITNLHSMKLTARIVNHLSSSTRTSTPKSSIASTNLKEVGTNPSSFNPYMLSLGTASTDATSISEPPLTQKDLGAAMAGLSFMARKTEENMAELFKQQSKKIQDNLESYIARMEMQMRALKPALAAQHQSMKENQTIMKEQQQIMDYQTTQISKLLTDNQDLQVRVQSLQADISILRSQTSYGNILETKLSLKQNDDGMSESKETAKHTTNKLISGDDIDSPSDVLGIEGKNIKMENIHLRSVIQKFARGIDEEPLLGGCGGTAMMYYGMNEDTTTNMESRSLRHVEPGGNMKALQIPFKKKEFSTAVEEIEEAPIDGGCGSLMYDIEGEIMRKIDSVISSRINTSAIPLDATRSIKISKENSCEEICNHASNIEVTLMQDEQIEEIKLESEDKKSVDEATSMDVLNGKNREDK